MKIMVKVQDVEREINRLLKLVGKSYDFAAAMWAIQTLIDNYELAFETKFKYDE